jgi:hypothetical protein
VITQKPKVGAKFITDHLGLSIHLLKNNSNQSNQKNKRIPITIFFLQAFRDELELLVSESYDWMDLKPKLRFLLKKMKHSYHDKYDFSQALKSSKKHKEDSIWNDLNCWKKCFIPRTIIKFDDKIKDKICQRLSSTSKPDHSLYDFWNDYITPQYIEDIIFDDDLIQEALSSLPNLKASGPDGIPYEFFKLHGDLITPLLCRTFASWFQYPDCIPFEFNSGFTSPIPKPNTDDFRLISLLNTDRKIFTKILSNHLFKFTKFSRYQLGFRPGLWINENILLFNHVLQRKKYIIDLIDFSNAFDSVHFKWMDYVIGQAFSDKWGNILKTCYGGITYLNYDKNLPISLSSGVRQGDCLSAFLFNISLDPLLNIIGKHINGANIANINIPILAYADDLTLIIKDNNEYHKCWKFIKQFCSTSGLSINMKKSHCVGNVHSKLEWRRKFKFLGIYFDNNKIDWKPLIEKLNSKVNFYSRFIKKLYITPRVTLFNALITSTLVYYLRSFKAPKILIDSYTRAVLTCFPNVNYLRLTASKDKCGFGLMDIDVCNRNWLSQWRWYMIRRIQSESPSIYLDTCNSISMLNNIHTPIYICWYSRHNNIEKYLNENELLHWLKYTVNVFFYFGDHLTWPQYWLWGKDDIFDGPFPRNDPRKKSRLICDIAPAPGFSLIGHISGFTHKDIFFDLNNFKSFKIYSPNKYPLTPFQIKHFGSTQPLLNYINDVKCIQSTRRAKWWALDHIHNANGLDYKSNCLVCSQLIRPLHFLECCSIPSDANFPNYFSKIDICWTLYLLHLRRFNSTFDSFNNLLIDFKLI